MGFTTSIDGGAANGAAITPASKATAIKALVNFIFVDSDCIFFNEDDAFEEMSEKYNGVQIG